MSSVGSCNLSICTGLPEPLLFNNVISIKILSGHIAPSVTSLAAITFLTADPEVASSISAWFHTFVEINYEIISMVILLPSADSRRVFVSYKRKYVHEVLVNCLVKLSQEKSVVR